MKLPSLAGALAVAVLTFSTCGIHAADDYTFTQDSLTRGVGVPAGRVESFSFNESKVFEGTRRDGWVYVPAQYQPGKPAALMVFQDGHAYVSTNGQIRVPIVFDNLIARGEMPVTVGVFINPGHKGERELPGDGWQPRSNRAIEYDSLGGDYARFLTDELIPFVTKKFNLTLTTDPKMRAICGMSSGGICAFTAAWERPDYFSKVLSHIGSFVNIRGGDVYPGKIRKTERKDIRVFLQDGSNDLNNEHGDWPLANKSMFSALTYKGYETRLVFGDGAHNGKHGGAIFPDSLRWLWQPEMSAASKSGGDLLPEVLGEMNDKNTWELVGQGYSFTDAACSDARGNFYFSDLPKATLYKVHSSGGAPSVWLQLQNGPKISGMKFGADGLLYACVQGTGTNSVKKIISIDPVSQVMTDIATDVQPNDLAVSSKGWVYFTDTGAGQVISVPTSGRRLSRPRPFAGGINRPNGIALSRNEDRLYVSEYGGTFLWVYEIDAEGRPSSGERVGVLTVPAGKKDSGGDGMILDIYGRSYVTSHLGLQVFDASGKLGGIIPRPQEKGTVSCAFGGEDQAYLYACSSDKVYRRKVLTQGITVGR